MGDNKTHVGNQSGMPVHGIEALKHIDFDCRDLIEKLPVAVYMCDVEGRIVFYNNEAANLWGRIPDPGKDKWCGSFKIFRHDGSDLPPDLCPMARTVREGVAVAVHCRAGIGRSGLTVGSVLVRLGVPAQDVFSLVSKARGLVVPDTPEQIKWFHSVGTRGVAL